jgi:hypothetical protein
MTFRGRRIVTLAVIGLSVAAIGVPASFAQDPYSGEGYGGSMDGGSPLSHPTSTKTLIADPFQPSEVYRPGAAMTPEFQAELDRLLGRQRAAVTTAASELDQLIAQQEAQNDAWFASKAIASSDSGGN